MIQSSAVIGGSFSPTFQFEKLESHTVFLRFPNFELLQNLSPLSLDDLIIGYLKNEKLSFANKLAKTSWHDIIIA